MKLAVKLVILLGVAVLIVGGWLWWRERATTAAIQLQDYEISPSAFVLLTKGSSPLLVEVRVIDQNGFPIVGANVDVRNKSGGNLGITGTNGLASIEVAEWEVEQLLLSGKPVLNRPNAYALGYPSAENGLSVLIIKRN
jgi:hypothetical protein